VSLIPFRKEKKKEDILFKIIKKENSEWTWETTLKADQLHKMLGIVQEDIVLDILHTLEKMKKG